MTLSINEAQSKYQSYITSINKLEEQLKKLDYSTEHFDEFELGATWHITYAGKLVARFEWNVPYILTYTPEEDQQEKAFEIDYVKNIEDWELFLNDILKSLTNLKESWKNKL